MRPLGIAGRVFLFTATIVCAVLAAALAIASQATRRAAAETERRGLEQAADFTAQLLAGRGRSLAGGAQVFVQGPHFRSLVAEVDPDDMLDQAFEAQEQLGANWVFITDERGTLLAKSDEPGVRGLSMAGIPLVAGALEGRSITGYGVSRDSLLFQAVAVPIVQPGGAPVGVLVATKLVDRQMARDVSAATGTDVVFYTIDARRALRVAATSLASSSAAAAALPATSALPLADGAGDAAAARATRTARIGGASYALHGAAVTTAGGEVVGGFVVALSTDGRPTGIAGVRRSLLVAGSLGLLLALLAAWGAARWVTRPVRALAAAAARARDGDVEGAAQDAVRAAAHAPRDEIAELARSLAALLAELREKQALVAMLGGAVTAPDDRPAADAEARTGDEPALPRARPVLARARGVAALMRPHGASWTARPVGALAAGAVVADRYAVQALVGSGGTGIVYKAVDLTLGEPVALKMLRPELMAEDPRALDELKHELRLTRRVSHRNVVRTHDLGVSRGIPFLTMEYVEGTSIAAVLAHHGALPAEVVLALARQLVRALQAAHEQGIVHGDLKPANILVALDGLVKVTDFGVATLVRRPWAAQPAGAEPPAPPRLAGAVVGTPEYMAPELLLGGPPDVRTDLYAAGMVLHECLTGATPFPRDTPRAFLARKLQATPTPRVRSIAPADEPGGGTLEAVVAWMTASASAERPASAEAVGQVLARIEV